MVTRGEAFRNQGDEKHEKDNRRGLIHRRSFTHFACCVCSGVRTWNPRCGGPGQCTRASRADGQGGVVLWAVVLVKITDDRQIGRVLIKGQPSPLSGVVP